MLQSLSAEFPSHTSTYCGTFTLISSSGPALGTADKARSVCSHFQASGHLWADAHAESDTRVCVTNASQRMEEVRGPAGRTGSGHPRRVSYPPKLGQETGEKGSLAQAPLFRGLGVHMMLGIWGHSKQWCAAGAQHAWEGTGRRWKWKG